MDVEAKDLETSQRARIEAAARGLERRAKQVLPGWIAMLDSLAGGARGEEFVDWLEIEREDGRDIDVGLRRHWVDPTIPFASDVLAPAHGALITSATLRDSESGADDWQSAEVRTGAHHLAEPPKRASFGSPFRYAEQARIFVIRDVERRDPTALASAYRELFIAAGGGALGLLHRCACCGPSRKELQRRSRRRGWRSMRSMWTGSIRVRLSICFAPRKMRASLARMRCAMASTLWPLAPSRRLRQTAMAAADHPAQGAPRPASAALMTIF